MKKIEYQGEVFYCDKGRYYDSSFIELPLSKSEHLRSLKKLDYKDERNEQKNLKGEKIMANKKTTEAQTPQTDTSNPRYDPDKRYWKVPKNRAENYAKELKAKVHTQGKYEGEQLTDKQKALRSGYLQCQSDHAATYKYKKALAEGKSKAEAAAIASQRKRKN